MIIIPQIPKLIGTPEEQLAQLYRYLSELTEYLGVTLNNISYTSFDEETQSKLSGG